MTTVTEEVTYMGIVPGELPRLLFQKKLRGKSGQTRIFTEAVPLSDAQMRCRVETELQAQDRIELTVEYDYATPGLSSKIVGFRKMSVSSAQLTNLVAA